jgi:hypothetical protein
MQTIAIRSLLFSTLLVAACHSDHAQPNAARAGDSASGIQTRTFHFVHQDARIASNYARAEFGCPPMEAVVRVECDGKSNSWLVKATAADMARMAEIAARYDREGALPPAPAK